MKTPAGRALRPPRAVPARGAALRAPRSVRAVGRAALRTPWSVRAVGRAALPCLEAARVVGRAALPCLRATHALRPLVTALLLTALGACGGDAQEPAVRVTSSDPELRAMAERLLPDLAGRAGLELQEPVRLERRSRAQLESYLRAKLDEELPPERAAATVEAYAMLGLVPADLELRELLLDLYTEQVAGFYEPDSTALFVLDDQPREALESLLLHELVHAVQDQSADLSAVTDPSLGNDRRTAAQAAIEGHATLVMLEFMAERMTGRPVDLARAPALSGQLLPAIEAMEAQFPALASAPEVIRRSLLFPYVQGAAFVQALWAEEGRVAPFGPHLPASTENVVEQDLSDAPTEVILEIVEGGTEVDGEILGHLEVGVLLETHAGAGAGAFSAGWDGDRYALIEREDGDRALVWVSVWDTPEQRDRFVTALTDALDGFDAEASLEPATVGERPAAILRLGESEGLVVEARLGGEG